MRAFSLFAAGLVAVAAREVRYVETTILPKWTPTYNMQVRAWCSVAVRAPTAAPYAHFYVRCGFPFLAVEHDCDAMQ